MDKDDNVVLTTFHGGLVTSFFNRAIGMMKEKPEVLLWGNRVFVIDEIHNSGRVYYRESSFYRVMSDLNEKSFEEGRININERR